ncbi:MAG: hypothetical protein Q8P26_04790 [Candidatus Levybacteria bacterium]|nr:hypothetical protein [Candidatus Levybacteria bacterium]
MKNIVFFLYVIFLFLFSIFSYAFVDSNLIYLKNIYTGFAFDNRLSVTVEYALFVSIFFIFYGAFVWFGVHKKIKSRDIFLLLGITVGFLIFSYPAMLSYDIFNYIATSKVLFFYHENPYVVMPIAFAGDPLLLFTHAANKIALYGPSWIALTGLAYIIGFGNFIVTLFATKIIVAAFYFGIVFLTWKISKNIVSVILFSLNPLVVVETLISGHNDIVMMFFAILSFYLLMIRKIKLAIVFFAISILIKYATIFLVPVFVYALLKIIKNKEVKWQSIFCSASLLMFIAFLLSPFREEIYPWYAIWFLSFVFLIKDKKLFKYILIAFSFGLALRYLPFMLFGTYAGITPVIKEVFTFIPAFLILLYFLFKRLCVKVFYQ